MSHVTSMSIPPAFLALPSERQFSSEFLELRSRAFDWLADYHDREHLLRAGDWMLHLAPDAPEYLVLAALTHDLERAVPGGPVRDWVNVTWDDEGYNRAHCDRSAEIVSNWMAEQDAPSEWVDQIRQPIREHEFGGSGEGDLMQAADSLSFLECNARLVAGWVIEQACGYDKGIEKLRWMRDRVRLGRARDEARRLFDLAVSEVDRRVERARHGIPDPHPGVEGLQGTSRHVDANGIRLHFLEYGRPGDPEMVIVPGITSPAATWEFAAVPLASDHHVWVMDVRGRGLSDHPASGFTTPDYAHDLAAALSELGLRRPLVLGHSMGARVAAAFGALHSDLRGPLIVADPPMTEPGGKPYNISLEAFLTSIAQARAGATAEDMRPYFPTWTDEQLRQRAEWLPTCDETAVAETWRLFHVERWLKWWRALEPPVLFLYGSKSPAVGPDGARRAAQALPAAELAVVPGAGHMLPFDALDSFLDAVRAFAGQVTAS